MTAVLGDQQLEGGIRLESRMPINLKRNKGIVLGNDDEAWDMDIIQEIGRRLRRVVVGGRSEAEERRCELVVELPDRVDVAQTSHLVQVW